MAMTLEAQQQRGGGAHREFEVKDDAPSLPAPARAALARLKSHCLQFSWRLEGGGGWSNLTSMVAFNAAAEKDGNTIGGAALIGGGRLQGV
jgi:hypothetical protein